MAKRSKQHLVCRLLGIIILSYVRVQNRSSHLDSPFDVLRLCCPQPVSAPGILRRLLKFDVKIVLQYRLELPQNRDATIVHRFTFAPFERDEFFLIAACAIFGTTVLWNASRDKLQTYSTPLGDVA